MDDPSTPDRLRKLLKGELERQMEPETDFSVNSIIREATSRGYGRKNVKHLLAELCDESEVQVIWADWTMIDDREELKLRLELIRSFSKVHPDLADFITFFFRASDPPMYQVAAIALGVHIETDSGLRKFYQDYCRQRSLSDDKPIHLNGERSRRRILLSACARYVTRIVTEPDFAGTLPLSLDTPGNHLSDNLSDLKITFAALDILLQGPVRPAEITRFAEWLAEEISKRNFEKYDRNLARNWSRLLSRLEDSDVIRVTNTFMRVTEQLCSTIGNNGKKLFFTGYRALSQLDEILQNLGTFKEDRKQAILREIDLRLPQSLSTLARIRSVTWEMRIQGPEGAQLPDIMHDHPKFDTIEHACRWIHELKNAGRNPCNRLSAHHAFLSQLLVPVERATSWLRTSYPERIMIAFLLVDIGQNELVSDPHMSRLVDSLIEQDLLQTLRSGSGYPDAIRLLTLLNSRESTDTILLLDANLIHQVPDSALLFSFIPSGRQEEVLGILADVFEHHLRLNLAKEEEFSYALYLYSIAIRKPHPLLFDLFAKICRDRTYLSITGTRYPVYELAEQLKSECHFGKNRKPDPEKPTEADASALADTTDPFLSDLADLRREMITLGKSNNLFESLERFEHLLNPQLETSENRPASLTSLVERIMDFNHNHTGITKGKGDLSDSVLLQLAILRKYSRDLFPDNTAGLHNAKNAFFELHELTKRMSHILIPWLGPVDSALFQKIVDNLHHQMSQWLGILDEVNRACLENTDQIISREKWQLLYRQVNSLPNHNMRKHLLGLIFYSMEAALAGPGDHESWPGQYSFIESAAASPYMDELTDSQDVAVWDSILTDYWLKLADEAMADGFETRLAKLMEKSTFSFVFNRIESVELLQRIRSWCYDRYHIGFSKKYKGLVPAGSSRITRRLTSYRSYFFHFTHVWLALLIGSILMLDFGDAWRSMAENGDIKGIFLTFLVGVTATAAYLNVDMKQKVKLAPEDSPRYRFFSRWSRIAFFLGVSLIFAFGITTLLWFLLSSTDEVVHGTGAILHILVWTGFSLFAGVFFGLLAKPS